MGNNGEGRLKKLAGLGEKKQKEKDEEEEDFYYSKYKTKICATYEYVERINVCVCVYFEGGFRVPYQLLLHTYQPPRISPFPGEPSHELNRSAQSATSTIKYVDPSA